MFIPHYEPNITFSPIPVDSLCNKEQYYIIIIFSVFLMISSNSLLTIPNIVYSILFPKSITREIAELAYHFYERDTWLDSILDEIHSPVKNSWGPDAPKFPSPMIPYQSNPIKWKRKRIIEVAKKYIGVPYKHHHIPDWVGTDGYGVDCSNFTSWVYNYALGIHFSSHIERQAQGFLAPGRMLKQNEKLMPGDLLFMSNKSKTKFTHVVLYIGKNKIIDVRGKGGVQIRKFKGWYKHRFAFARRIIE